MLLEEACSVWEGQKVDALHADGDWHRATVLAVRGGKSQPAVRVHFDAYRSTWDEKRATQHPPRAREDFERGPRP